MGGGPHLLHVSLGHISRPIRAGEFHFLREVNNILLKSRFLTCTCMQVCQEDKKGRERERWGKGGGGERERKKEIAAWCAAKLNVFQIGPGSQTPLRVSVRFYVYGCAVLGGELRRGRTHRRMMAMHCYQTEADQQRNQNKKACAVWLLIAQ